MELKEIRLEINEELEKRRKELSLTFIEEKHIYSMKDIDGIIKKNFPSVSKLIKNFFPPFDSEGLSLKMAKGDLTEQKRLLKEWKDKGNYSTDLGSLSHYFLEKYIVEQYNNFKPLREPIFECNEEQISKSNNMISAGKKFIDLMHERGGILLDTEPVLGDPELGYTGQADDIWVIMNKDKTDWGLIVTDFKTNQPKNFEIQYYTGKMLKPFESHPDMALTHYFLQLPLYGRLLLKMLEGTKFKDKKLLGGIVILLKEEGTFTEYRVPSEINNKILTMDLSQYLK